MKNAKQIVLNIILIALIVLVGVVTSCFSIIKNDIYFWLIMSFLAIMTLLLISSFFIKNDKFFRISCMISAYFLVFYLVFFVLKITGIIDNIRDIDRLKDFVANSGNAGIFVYFSIALLQVLVIPLPAIITILAGSILFGPATAFLICTTGILTGSIIAFMIGRTLGKKVLKWIDKESLADKYLDILQRKGGIVLFLMFLLPLFPDDLLCIVAGMSNMKLKSFALVSFISRTIGVAFITFFGSGSIFSTTWSKVLFYIIVALLGIIVVTKVSKEKKKIEQ